MEALKLGVAYHGNRILKHIKDDMKDIVDHNMNLCVHMYTHNDMDRNKNLMKDIFDITKDYGLELWVDNWGIGGPPGDKSHFLQYSPESHRIISNGTVDPVRVCYNSKAYVDFSKKWIDHVVAAGGNKLFWDEPHLDVYPDGTYACHCPECQKLFEEKYNKKMPEKSNEDIIDFQAWTIGNYFATVTKYAHEAGCENITCLMPHSLQFLKGVVDLPYIDDIGTDPYWHYGRSNEPYKYVYEISKPFMDEVREHGKKSHIWLQAFDNRNGSEAEIYEAADAAYDAGAKTILAWSYRGGEAVDYKADCGDMVWQVTGDAMRRIRDRYQDDVRWEYRKKMGI